MLSSFRAISLTSPAAAIIIAIVVAVCFLLAAWGVTRAALRRRTLLALAIAASLTTLVYLLLEVTWKPFPDPLPVFIYVYGGSAFFVAASAVLQQGRRAVLAVTTVFAVVAGCAGANAFYTQYPTVGSFDPVPVAQRMSYSQFLHGDTPPRLRGRDVGAIVTVDFPATVSGFVHRPAKVYVPPAYFTRPDLDLPVMIMMVGNPGAPKQWLDTADGAETLDSYQQEHDGVSPIFVSIDGTGTFMDNPLCADAALGNAMTWLTDDVPTGIAKAFRVNPDIATWTIGGFSYGATCTLQIIAKKPELFSTFLAFSIQPAPTLGTRQATIDQLFGGDAKAYEAYNPDDVFARALADHSTAYHHIAGRFVAGNLDTDAVKAQDKFHHITQELGMETTTTIVPGRHNYQTWRQALRDTLGFAAARGGL